MTEGTSQATATVRVKFYGPLRQFVSATEQSAHAAPGTPIRRLILDLGVPEEHLVYTMVLQNERRVPLDTLIVDGDALDVFQPVAGG